MKILAYILIIYIIYLNGTILAITNPVGGGLPGTDDKKEEEEPDPLTLPTLNVLAERLNKKKMLESMYQAVGEIKNSMIKIEGSITGRLKSIEDEGIKII